jgi:hypothetical protein
VTASTSPTPPGQTLGGQHGPGCVEVVPGSIRGVWMVRLVAGEAALAALVLAGGTACAGLNGPAAAQPAAPVLSRSTAPQAGVIRGRFVIFGTMGRPGPAADHPARGTVMLTHGRHRVLIIRAGHSGTFVAHLPPGTYNVYGHSPQLITVSDNGTEREDKVTLAHPVTVTAGHTTKIVLRAIVP